MKFRIDRASGADVDFGEEVEDPRGAMEVQRGYGNRRWKEKVARPKLRVIDVDTLEELMDLLAGAFVCWASYQPDEEAGIPRRITIYDDYVE